MDGTRVALRGRGKDVLLDVRSPGDGHNQLKFPRLRPVYRQIQISTFAPYI